MIEASTIPAEKLRLTTRMIRDQALERGWKAWLYYVDSSHMRLQRPDGKVLEVYSATPPTTSYAAGHRANDKYFTHVVLQSAGLPMPETYLEDALQDGMQRAEQFLTHKKSFVIKPLDAGHGNGVTVNITRLDDVPRAFAFAQEHSTGVIIQEHITQPVDVRITCINYKAVASLVRIPARVKGDGQHTVGELIDIENQSGHRGENYTKELCTINKAQAEVYMAKAIHDVPAKGEFVQVLGTANVGTGGETVDVTDDMPPWLLKMAQKAARVMQLPSCGVDFLLNAMPKTSDTPMSLKACIIEINKCPALYLHETPTYGTPRPTVKAYLDYLASL